MKWLGNGPSYFDNYLIVLFLMFSDVYFYKKLRILTGNVFVFFHFASFAGQSFVDAIVFRWCHSSVFFCFRGKQ